MRVSGDPRSSDYWRNKMPQCPTIVLDGKVIEHVVTADEELGTVEVEIWRDGKMIHDGESILIEVLLGRVQIIAPAPDRH